MIGTVAGLVQLLSEIRSARQHLAVVRQRAVRAGHHEIRRGRPEPFVAVHLQVPSVRRLIVVLVATAASALPAESHEWYAGLRSPSGMTCCNLRD